MKDSIAADVLQDVWRIGVGKDGDHFMEQNIYSGQSRIDVLVCSRLEIKAGTGRIRNMIDQRREMLCMRKFLQQV